VINASVVAGTITKTTGMAIRELLLLGMKLENQKYMRFILGIFEDVDEDREFFFKLEILKRGFLNIFGLRT